MYQSTKAVSAAAIISAFALPAVAAPGNGNNGNNIDVLPAAPVGALLATPKVVQTGTHPTLNWSIVYPSKVNDVSNIAPPGTITITKNNTYVDVRVVGVGVTECNASGEVANIAAESRISLDGSSFTQLFYGTNADVDPTHSLFTKKVKAGTVINFGGRYDKSGSWSPFYTTKSSNMQVVALKDGDPIPTSYDLSQSGRMAEYLKPYVDSTGRVKVGPMSILIMAEYASTDRSQACFDYQDFVLLVSLSGKNNNGHGNNLDGVDSSNPGKGKGGPTGLNNTGEDPSAGVDDEIR